MKEILEKNEELKKEYIRIKKMFEKSNKENEFNFEYVNQ